MIDYSGLEKFKSQQKIHFKDANFRNAENFIDIGECTETLSLLNVLMLRYLQKVQRICGEFLTDMPNDLPYILGCDWNFPHRVKHGEQLAWMYLWCKKTRNDS